MHAFERINDRLTCEGADLAALAEQHGTPLYVYSAETVFDHYRRLDAALAPLDHLVCYAVKANSTGALLAGLTQLGGGFDIVSAGELFRVIRAGGDPSLCTFAGVGKTAEEIGYALDRGILCFNVESEPELERINAVAERRGVRAPIAVRVNPDVEAGTHKYISTGRSGNKFGIGLDRILEVYAIAAALPHLSIVGVQTHIGSQITRPGPFAEAVAKMIPLVSELKARHGIRLFSIGGGMGIVYRDALASGTRAWWEGVGSEAHPLDLDAYARAVVPLLQPLGLRILFEPGRFIVGNAGVLLTRVQYVKRAPDKTFVVVDAAMNDLIRPALYQSYHEIVPVIENPDAPVTPVDVVGPVCESGDFFAQDRPLPEVYAGDLLALMSAGAYGFTMASTYNSRPLTAEVVVRGGKPFLARERGTLEDLVRGEHLA